ncbi:HelD family protein [Jonesia quinghaiensis]|uniref:HelD family protein n=1 Tax=Jonesia quinghaiensis TaxID=262806 RepID=UPI00041AF2E5|nr:AAA family ATPase [Jonesia quinghaiensis]
MADHREALVEEQQIVDHLYARLDTLRESASTRLAQVRREGPSGSPQNRSERDSFATHYEDRLALLQAVEERLIFGRLDLTEDATRYIGRIGMTDANQRSILTDWRAPAAEPFYRATLAHPLGVRQRRHITTRRRTVTAVEDEIFDLSGATSTDQTTLHGEGALLSALSAGRTGKMGDIVATIQREQDDIIRSPLQGAVVVQGGPGTGKTAVALHRAAYLLYAHRRVLERSGVLLVGPSEQFLRYIDQVLPSLGETGVVSTTLGALLPHVTAHGHDTGRGAVLKGETRFAQYIKNAVRARQRVPQHDETLRIDGHDIVISRRDVRDAMARARRANKPHNDTWEIFAKDMLNRLAQQYVADMPYHVAEEDRGDILTELRMDKRIRRAINLAWFPISAAQLVDDLLSREHRLAEAAPDLSPADRQALLRPAGSPWTQADIPILDEAEELLGPLSRPTTTQRTDDRSLEYARDVLAQTGAAGLVSAEDLHARFQGASARLSVAERAASDREWTYGHIIVDEAQELSAMAWRSLIRRCPTRSFTIVGDTAQTSDPAGATSWSTMFDPLFSEHWTRRDLTVNYRTPRTVADLAMRFAELSGLSSSPLTSARDIPDAAAVIHTQAEESNGVLIAEVNRCVERYVTSDSGQVAVLSAPSRIAAVRELLASVQTGAHAVRPSGLVILTPREAKGLEFDAVVVESPERMSEELSASDLFVALTRPTQYLCVVTDRVVPWLSDLSEDDA